MDVANHLPIQGGVSPCYRRDIYDLNFCLLKSSCTRKIVIQTTGVVVQAGLKDARDRCGMFEGLRLVLSSELRRSAARAPEIRKLWPARVTLVRSNFEA